VGNRNYIAEARLIKGRSSEGSFRKSVIGIIGFQVSIFGDKVCEVR
jgi:hypothetical protein